MKEVVKVFAVVFAVVALLVVGIHISTDAQSNKNVQEDSDLKFYSETIQLPDGSGDDVDVSVTVSSDSSTYSVLEDKFKLKMALMDASTNTAITARHPRTWIPDMISVNFDTKLDAYVVLVFGEAQNSYGVSGDISNLYIIDKEYEILPYPIDNQSK